MAIKEPSFYTQRQEEAEKLQKKLIDHPFFKKEFKSATYSLEFAREIAKMQLGYNVYFVAALSNMRKQFVLHEKFVVEFLDHHLATEFGSDLELVELKQNGETHVKMIYDLINSLDIPKDQRINWSSSIQVFFEKGIEKIIGSSDLGYALGGLYADEVLANCWFMPFYKSLSAFKNNSNLDLNLEFFRTHAEEVEPAHQDHALLLEDYCKEMNLSSNSFKQGATDFLKELLTLFDDFHRRISKN